MRFLTCSNKKHGEKEAAAVCFEINESHEGPRGSHEEDRKTAGAEHSENTAPRASPGTESRERAFQGHGGDRKFAQWP